LRMTRRINRHRLTQIYPDKNKARFLSVWIWVNRWRFLVFIAICVVRLFCGSAIGGEPLSLEARLAPLAKAHKGQVAIAAKHLGSGESYFLNADVPMPTASLIKLAVMVE